MAGQGGYARFAADGSDLRALGFDSAQSLADVGHVDTVRSDASSPLRYQDEGPLLALLLLPLAALAARRGWLLVLPLLLLPLAPPRTAQAQSATAENAASGNAAAAAGAKVDETAPGALAQFWNDLWMRRDRQAWDALQEGAPERAAALAEDPALRGSAAYRAGDLESALADFAQGDDARSHYNRGNALAGLQRYDEALAAYDAALAREPAHADAAANRKAVKDWLKQQEQQQQQAQDGEQGKDGEKAQSGDSGEPSPDGEQTQDEGGEPESSEGTPPPSSESPQNDSAQGEQGGESDPQQAEAEGDAAESEQAQQDFNEAMQQALQQAEAQPEGEPQGEPLSAEAMAEAEKRQALEQLMRRVPDDPGGLLRRKFLLEYQRRQREGDPR
jgi:Ca-activated chloride channel family protein